MFQGNSKVLLCLLSIVPQLHFKQDHVHCFPVAGDYSVLYDAVFNHTRGHDRQGMILRRGDGGPGIAHILALALMGILVISLSLNFGDMLVLLDFPKIMYLLRSSESGLI